MLSRLAHETKSTREVLVHPGICPELQRMCGALILTLCTPSFFFFSPNPRIQSGRCSTLKNRWGPLALHFFSVRYTIRCALLNNAYMVRKKWATIKQTYTSCRWNTWPKHRSYSTKLGSLMQSTKNIWSTWLASLVENVSHSLAGSKQVNPTVVFVLPVCLVLIRQLNGVLVGWFYLALLSRTVWVAVDWLDYNWVYRLNVAQKHIVPFEGHFALLKDVCLH